VLLEEEEAGPFFWWHDHHWFLHLSCQPGLTRALQFSVVLEFNVVCVEI